MCGIVGIATRQGVPLGLTSNELIAARDTMIHRGPDDAGLWFAADHPEKAHAALGHRRLAVLDPTPAGHQPMISADGRWVLAYNGELYNDAELRQQLRLTGTRFGSSCDAETVLAAIERWGRAAFNKMRGMFAVAAFDTRDHRLVLARDPLGVKPLYLAREGSRVAFASEPRAIFALPGFQTRPDLVTMGAYLATIRPTLGSRTLFAGVRTLMPGEVIEVDLDVPSVPEHSSSLWCDSDKDADASEPTTEELREAIRGSVRSHLRSDVQVCALLSGGLDSAIITHLAAPHLDPMMTFCAGAAESPDIAAAQALAETLGSDHRESVLNEQAFLSNWSRMIQQTGLPLSTPNEVAIDAIARTLRDAGNTVTISGEGADELFAGYDLPMRQAHEFAGSDDPDAGAFHLHSNQWTALDVLGSVMISAEFRPNECREAVLETYRSTWLDAARGVPSDDPLRAHRRFHRMMNLPNLLRRLDSATMLASVEGRTPFADIAVARLAERIPTHRLFDHTVAAEDRPATKLALRQAFASDLPRAVLDRPKASFPLPFEHWLSGMSAYLRTSVFARETFSPAAVEAVASRPGQLWTLAWPMLNLAVWGDHWWGLGVPTFSSGQGVLELVPNERA